MEVIFENGKYFKKLMELTEPIVSSAVLYFNEDGISINSLDHCKIALLVFHIDKSHFKKFKLKEKELELGLDLKRLNQYFKTFNDNDEMILKCTSPDKLTLLFKNDKTKKKVTHRIPTLNLDYEPHDIPDDSEFQTLLSANPNTLLTIIKNCSMFGGDVKIVTDKDLDSIEFSVETLEGKSEFSYEQDDNEFKVINIVEDVTASYQLDYLMKFAKFSSISTELDIQLNNNAPIFFKYVTPIGNVLLYLTPKLDD